MNKIKNLNKLNNYVFYLKNERMSNSLIIKAIENFWNVRIKPLNDQATPCHLGILVRISDHNNVIKTLGRLKKVNIGNKDKSALTQFIINSWEEKDGAYDDFIITRLTFSYWISEGNINIDYKSFADEQIIPHQNLSHFKAPIVSPYDEVSKYGKIIDSLNLDKLETGLVSVDNKARQGMLSSKKTFIQVNEKAMFVINTVEFTDSMENRVIIYRNGEPSLTYIDKAFLNQDYFTRTVGSREYVCNNDGTIRYMTQDKKLFKYIEEKKREDKLFSPDFLTLDIETYVDGSNNNLVPYLTSIYDGADFKTFYLTDFLNKDTMMKAVIDHIIMVRRVVNKKNPINIYVHNLAKFDSTFLLRYMVGIKGVTVKPIINNGRLIKISLSARSAVDTGLTKSTIYFFDSLQILPIALRDLANSFNTNAEQKLDFDHDKVNDTNLLQLKDEAIKYCNQDCLALHSVMCKFGWLIWNNWNVNITKYATISSIAFAVYKANFMPNKTIPMIAGDIFKDIKQSYTGGSTDMFIPRFPTVETRGYYQETQEEITNDLLDHGNMTTYLLDSLSNPTTTCPATVKQVKGETLYGYDVNSLYPFIMATTELPAGKPIYFEGDISKMPNIENKLGFYYCEVTTPEFLLHPTIQLHHNRKTIAPLGTFKGMFYSKEIINAKALGYVFDIKWGYYFTDKANLFEKYIKDLYSLRLSFDKSHPMNLICKLLMNSLYGRFGMDDNYSNIHIFNDKQFSKFIKSNDSNSTLSVEELNSNYIVEVQPDKHLNLMSTNYETHNTSLPIASAITAEARILMGIFKNNPLIKLYYTDTDSIFIDKNADQLNEIIPSIVNNKELGKLKLEYVIKQAVFLAPKCYWLVLEDGNNIIRVKGIKKNYLQAALDNGTITFNTFTELLAKDNSVSIVQDKWNRDIIEGTINIKEQTYEIKQNNNKRELIYNSNNVCFNTKPLVLLSDNPLRILCHKTAQQSI